MDRIQARAIRRCGELLKEIEPKQGKRTDQHSGGAPTRSEVARSAGLSRDQKVTALRVANVPAKDEAQVEAQLKAEEAENQRQVSRGLPAKPKRSGPKGGRPKEPASRRSVAKKTGVPDRTRRDMEQHERLVPAEAKDEA